MSIFPSLSKSKIATPPHIGCGKYFRPLKLLLLTYWNFERAATSTKPGRFVTAVFPVETLMIRNARSPEAVRMMIRFSQTSGGTQLLD
jgi:hypothetical protein